MTTRSTGTVTGTANMILRGEGAAVLISACYGYSYTGVSWWWFALLVLVPDLFMLGYLANARTGAALYNLGHTTLVPAALAALALWVSSATLLALGLIWLAHIGADRMIGYGLKYPDRFRHSHLSGE